MSRVAEQSRSGAIPNRVPFEQLQRRAQALVPTLKARAEQTERDRRVSAETTQMLADADLFRLMQPARFGGFEYGFTELLDLSSELGEGLRLHRLVLRPGRGAPMDARCLSEGSPG